MKMVVRISVVALLCGLVGGGTTAVAADQADKILTHFRAKNPNIPAQVPAKVSEPKDSATMKGEKEGVIELGTPPNIQKVPYVLSKDGRYVVFGEINDLTVDPYKQVMDKISLKGRPTKGPATAKVTIVEYSDFQCPFCARGYQTLENQVLKEYGDKVKVVFKQFPLQSIHPWAEPAAVASLCAFQQKPEAFWKVYDYLFQNQKDMNVQNVKEKVTAAAGDGVDAAKLGECIDKQATLADVTADQQEGQGVGVNGTPAFVINGRLLSGAQPFEQFKAILDAELASAK
ncbi:MAG TPA: thioredoxin domain-containing protein [Candidatus Binatia bacterium]|nr:thioredoxin domain-containing protein [Candidatus Binatia bacterium]